jgi:hypothetical protein
VNVGILISPHDKSFSSAFQLGESFLAVTPKRARLDAARFVRVSSTNQGATVSLFDVLPFLPRPVISLSPVRRCDGLVGVAFSGYGCGQVSARDAESDGSSQPRASMAAASRRRGIDIGAALPRPTSGCSLRRRSALRGRRVWNSTKLPCVRRQGSRTRHPVKCEVRRDG